MIFTDCLKFLFYGTLTILLVLWKIILICKTDYICSIIIMLFGNLLLINKN